MFSRLLELKGPEAWLAWASLYTISIGVISVLYQAKVKLVPSAGLSLGFRISIIILFMRFLDRLLYHHKLSYEASLIYFAPGVFLLLGTIDLAKRSGDLDWMKKLLRKMSF